MNDERFLEFEKEYDRYAAEEEIQKMEEEEYRGDSDRIYFCKKWLGRGTSIDDVMILYETYGMTEYEKGVWMGGEPRGS